MELWEFNACVRAYNRQSKEKAREQLALAWHFGAFCGSAFAGKLRPLKSYLKDDEIKAAPQISREEFEAKLKSFKESRG